MHLFPLTHGQRVRSANTCQETAYDMLWPGGNSGSAGLFAAVLALALLKGCSVGVTEYERPDVVEKEQWSSSKVLDVDGAETIRVDWWHNFNDPQLDELMSQALVRNPDLRILAARTGVAEAAIGQANAARLPTIDAAVGTNFQKTEGLPSTTAYSQAAAIGWELDIWGKLQKGVDAQTAQFKATEADWRAGYLTLASDVSTSYFQILQFDEQIDRQREAMANGETILMVNRDLFEAGVVPETQVMQQEAELDRLNTDLVELQRLRQITENGLAALLGKAAGDLKIPPGHLSDSVELIRVPGGLPSQLLSRRPDIIAAEYRVLEAHELEGKAKLAQLPSISLTGSSGSTSMDLVNLLKTFTFGFSPVVSIPIFDPNVAAEARVSTERTKVAEEEYRKTVIRAFEEVENALVSLASRRQQREYLLKRRNTLRTVAGEVRAQLDAGMVTQLEVFESERSLLNAELGLLENHQLALSETVALYKALGGGWPSETVGQ